MSHEADYRPPKPTRWKGRLWAYLAERIGLDAMLELGVKKRVPIHRTTIFYFLGGMALFLFVVQVVTGVLLSLYYKPSPDQAFESVRAIMTEVEFGWLIRSVHSWGANLIIGVLFLHILTTYMMRAYRRPREFTWLTGIMLLGVFMALGFSGYLLPWNELSFFATNVGTKLTEAVPVIGYHVKLVARGGENVTGDTLSRFYALHVAILPLVALGLTGVHLFLVQKHGMSVPDQVARLHGGQSKVPSIPFVPDFLLRDAVGWYLALGILAALAALFPWELGDKADPFGVAPKGIKPEWYFLFMFQALKQLPPHVLGLEGETVGVLFFAAVGLAVFLVPFMDRGPRARQILNVLAAPWVAFIIVMTAWGWFFIPEEGSKEVIDHAASLGISQEAAYEAIFMQIVRLRIIMGTSLFVGMLALCDRFLQRGGTARFLLGIVAALAVLLLVAVVIWELRV